MNNFLIKDVRLLGFLIILTVLTSVTLSTPSAVADDSTLSTSSAVAETSALPTSSPVAETSTLPTSSAAAVTRRYKVGDVTPTGGTVFFVLPPDTVSQWHYLEVAPDNWNSGKLPKISFKKAESYVYTFSDKSWYIPSSAEFVTLHSEYRAKRLKSITLKSGAYWTSTGVVRNKQIQSLQSFNTSNRKLKSYSYKDAINGKVLLPVRPIRYFD